MDGRAAGARVIRVVERREVVAFAANEDRAPDRVARLGGRVADDRAQATVLRERVVELDRRTVGAPWHALALQKAHHAVDRLRVFATRRARGAVRCRVNDRAVEVCDGVLHRRRLLRVEVDHVEGNRICCIGFANLLTQLARVEH